MEKRMSPSAMGRPLGLAVVLMGIACSGLGADGTGAAGCEWRQDLVAFPGGKDFAGRGAFECNCPSAVGEDGLTLTCNNTRLRVKPFFYTPQRPFPGPAAVVVWTEGPLWGSAVLRVKVRERKAKPVEYTADWKDGLAVFDTALDPGREYEFDSLDFVLPKGLEGNPKLVIRRIEGLYRTGEAEAVAFEVRTRSPLNTLDWGSDETAVAVLRNRSGRDLSVRGVLRADDSYGRAFRLPVEAKLSGDGGAKEIRLPREKGKADAKGVWSVTAELTAGDGSKCVRTDRFAILDEHPVTPRIPFGKFRPGIHCHSATWVDAERVLTHDAAVRMGAKLVRIDYVFSQSATWDPAKKDFDFAKSDRFLEELEARGLAVDAIVQESGFNRFTEDFCERLARHYGERIDYYEVGNEWDLASESWLTPTQAIDWQKLAYRGLKKGNPKARVTTNGWAVEDSNGHANVTQRGFQETVMAAAKDACDIHAVHLHGPFMEFTGRLRRFFRLREACGVTAPFVLNETALNIRYRGAEEVAESVWTKMIHGWAHGATDHVWYNMRASQFDPDGSYGVVSRDFRPRLTFAAYSGFTAVLGDHDFEKTIVEKEGRMVYRFRRRSGGEIVIAGWDLALKDPVSVPVQTDAARVWVADVMNNRRAVEIADGIAVLPLAGAPQAWIFEGATFARPGKSILAASKAPPRVIRVSPVRPDYGWDLRLDKYAQVHEEYPADPATAHRTWKGPDDCSGTLIFRMQDGKIFVNVSVIDENDTPGDTVQVWRDGRDVTADLKFTRVRHGDHRTAYRAEWPDAKSCCVNVRFIDDDGFGGIDGWMDYVPFDAKAPDPSVWPIVRFE